MTEPSDDLTRLHAAIIDAAGAHDWPALSNHVASIIATVRQLRREVTEARAALDAEQARRENAEVRLDQIRRMVRFAVARGFIHRDLREEAER